MSEGKVYSIDDVFVPGGIPELTYVSRAGGELESELQRIRKKSTKMITLTGSTKTGKTVLVHRIFPRNIGEALWIDGGTVKDEGDFWSSILAELPEPSIIEVTDTVEEGEVLKSKLQAEANAAIMKVSSAGISETNAKLIRSNSSSSIVGSERVRAVRALRAARVPLVIDDFHYLARPFQGDVLRALKPLILDGLPVIAIAIPHRRFDAIRVEREMTGRLEPIKVPEWTPKELAEIAEKGFPLMNLTVERMVVDRLVTESYGSPHLMQEFCKQLCRRSAVSETVAENIEIRSVDDDLFREVADQTGRVVYEKLRKGPRPRTDRMQRELTNGGHADIYGVVLIALAQIQPGMGRVEYEQLRAIIQSIVKNKDQVPQRHEVSRVLDKMSTIATSDESSVPVIDWDSSDGILHITDPFFAFYLKWGT